MNTQTRPCPICGLGVSTARYAQHVKADHTHVCTECGIHCLPNNSGTSGPNIKRHMLDAHGIIHNGRTATRDCPTCGLAVSLMSYTLHVNAPHTATCTTCGAACIPCEGHAHAKSRNLRAHMRELHEQELPHSIHSGRGNRPRAAVSPLERRARKRGWGMKEREEIVDEVYAFTPRYGEYPAWTHEQIRS